MKKLLVVIDMQNDFITGPLGTPEAQSILPNVTAKIRVELAGGAMVVFTQDTHNMSYLQTKEGRDLPVIHCVEGTRGHEIAASVISCVNDPVVFRKDTFGSLSLAEYARRHAQKPADEGGVGEIELIGLCTDICVISNALLIKSFTPETPISVDASCCAGVTPESHENALTAMEMCYIAVTGR